MSEIKRHAQEIFTATLEAFLASPKSGRLTDDLVRQIAAQADQARPAFPRAGRAESLTGVGDSFAAPGSVV